MSATVMTLGGKPWLSSTFHADIRASLRRTRWTMTVSVVFHALLLLFIMVQRHVEANLPTITEITLLEPGDLAAAASAPAAPGAAPVTATGLPRSDALDLRFWRKESRAEMTPEPQDPIAYEDQINSRLATLRNTDPSPARSITAGTPSTVWSPTVAVPGKIGGGGTGGISLTRSGGDGGPPLSLTRGHGTGGAPSLAAATLPAGKGTGAAPARDGDATARRTVAGASLAGPIADRRILSHATPIYPEWAKREGVEGSVTIYFVVRPDGSVKENLLVQKTAGFEDFDESARTALRVWRFEPLRAGRTGEQWGTITFHFRLSSAD